MTNNARDIVLGVSGIVVLVSLIAGSMIGLPKYRVYKQAQRGKAALAEAEWDRLIEIEEAAANNMAAESKAKSMIKIAQAQADAEIIRAGGVAESNRIIADGLKGNTEYLHYLWIQGLQEGKGERIYIPTEASLPIFEAK